MICPRCDRPTTKQRHDGIEVEQCDSCAGMFLHPGELNKIAEPTQGDLEFSTVHDDAFQHDDPFGPIRCIQCGEATMSKVEFNIHTNIVLDYCPACRGFWLDGRELDRINEEVRELNAASDELDDPPMLWFARFIWGLPR